MWVSFTPEPDRSKLQRWSSGSSQTGIQSAAPGWRRTSILANLLGLGLPLHRSLSLYEEVPGPEGIKRSLVMGNRAERVAVAMLTGGGAGSGPSDWAV